MISVVIPTIKGRESHLVRCLAAYEETPEPLELLVVRDERTCGLAWAKGGAQATGDYIHFSADDLVPWPCWAANAISHANKGEIPCPRIVTPDGSLESCGQWGAEMDEGTETNIARIPFLSREMWDKGGWTIPLHYYTDNHVWKRGQELGYPTVVCRGYKFTHYYASEGRLETMDADLAAYQAGDGTF